MYKARYADDEKFYRNGKEVKIKWHPSLHMPKEAARIFLKVTDIRLERLQDKHIDGNALADIVAALFHEPHADPVFRAFHQTECRRFYNLVQNAPEITAKWEELPHEPYDDPE